jgi:nicotinamide-nucleotide amidase
VRVEIVAVGTELLLGQVVDTNSSRIADELARVGLDCVFQTRVGDNHARIVSALTIALGRADAVVVCGGLGPTPDDITREAIAEVMGVELLDDPLGLSLVQEFFASRSVEMPISNLRQAQVPEGATLIHQRVGTAPGLICPVGSGVVYAIPGVPVEMEEMLVRAVVPELLERAGERAVIVSRSLRTVGVSEAKIAEDVGSRLDALDAEGPGAPTIAFLANVAQGVRVRVTVKAEDEARAHARLDREEALLRDLLGESVFGLDDDTIESVVGARLVDLGLTLAVAESFTGGEIASRLIEVPGASQYFRGGVVAYDEEVKFSLLRVPRGPVVSGESAVAMANGVRDLLGSDVAVATTGVAGPASQEGHPPGTAWCAIALPGRETVATSLTLHGSRARVRASGSLRALDLLRRALLEQGAVAPLS